MRKAAAISRVLCRACSVCVKCTGDFDIGSILCMYARNAPHRQFGSSSCCVCRLCSVCADGRVGYVPCALVPGTYFRQDGVIRCMYALYYAQGAGGAGEKIGGSTV